MTYDIDFCPHGRFLNPHLPVDDVVSCTCCGWMHNLFETNVPLCRDCRHGRRKWKDSDLGYPGDPDPDPGRVTICGGCGRPGWTDRTGLCFACIKEVP